VDLTILHDFNGIDGHTPAAVLVMDDEGALYGSTISGGPHKLWGAI
jgi:hypothetical protein